MIHTLYLVIERSPQRPWKGPSIAAVKKKKPRLARPSEQAIVRLDIEIPDRALEPRVVSVQIKPEHIVVPAITAVSAPV